ncbi:MAG TPA: glycosyltransferase [Candidatus Dormibacteraeota bacterium]|nr:glycosyltransferase [Candidatus Dormibacteraeota bacterium]
MHTSPTAAPGADTNGGLNVYVREVGAAFGRRGVVTDVFTRRRDERQPLVEGAAPAFRVVSLPAGPPGVDKYRLLDHVPGFTDRVEAFIRDSGLRYHLIYSHYWLSGLVACVLRGRLGVPWAHRAHTLALVKNRHLAPGARPEPEFRVDLEGEISRCADLLVVSTEAEGDELRRSYHIRPEQVAVVPPGVNGATFRPLPKPLARLLIGQGDRRLFVFVGRLEPLKGVSVILHALARVVADGRHPDVRLLILGDDGGDGGGERARLGRLVAELGLDDRVRFLGPVAQSELPTYYAAAEACLVPSYSESFGLVGLEAQACGTAVVASNVAGLASVVREGTTGFLIDGPDPEAYADRMRRLLEEPGLAVRMGRNGRRRAEAFSWERTADLLLERFRRLAGSAPLPNLSPDPWS